MQPNPGGTPGNELVGDLAASADSGPHHHFGPSDPVTPKRKPGAGAEWFTPGRFALILAGCIFAAYPEVVLGLRTFFFRDFGYFGYPLAFHHRESFWRGEIPLWNPLSNCGLPFLAQWNTMTLYPGSLFYLVCPLSWSLSGFCLVHQFFAGLGMYFLAASWTRNRLAASIAGMVFAFNGLVLNSLMWPNNIAALGWMPWVVLQVERAWHGGGRQVVLASVFAAMQMLAGAPEIILFTWTILASMLVVQVASSRNERVLFVKRFLLVGLIVTGLSAVQLGPFLDLLAHSQRDTGFGRSSWSMPGTGWANLLVPLFHCFSSPSNQGVFFQTEQWWTSSYYLGVGPLVLAFLAVWRLRAQRTWLLAWLATLSAVLALGDNGYVYKWVREVVPPFGLLRYPIKFVVLAVFSLPLLAAFEVARMPVRDTAEALRFKRNLCISWVGVLAVMSAVLWTAWRFPFQWDDWPATFKNALARAACSALFLGLLLAVQTSNRLNLRRLLQVALLVVTWLDFMTHAPRQNPTVPRLAFQPGLLHLSPMPAHGLSRVMISPAADAKFRSIAAPKPLDQYLGTRLGLFSNCNLLDGIPKVNGFFSLYLRESDQICAMLYASRQSELAPLIDFLNVSHVTAPGELFNWVYRTNSQPFVTAGQQPAFAEGTEVMRALAAADFSSRRVAYLPEEARQFITAQKTSARVREQRFSAHRGEFVVEAIDPTLVVISQPYYHCWRAFVDGGPTRLWRANHAFEAVAVPSGRHLIELIYRDPFFCFGVLVSTVTLLGCLTCYWQRTTASGGERNRTDEPGPR
jgi:hypothetical protein